MFVLLFFGAKIWPAAAGTGELARDLRDQTRPARHWLATSTERPGKQMPTLSLSHGSERLTCITLMGSHNHHHRHHDWLHHWHNLNDSDHVDRSSRELD